MPDSPTLSPTADAADSLEFWRDPTLKDQANVQALLLAWLRRRHNAEGFSLHHANLSNINLARHGSPTGYQLVDCDLYRANLRNSHLFGINLSGSSLMKADLRGASLHCANLADCNLLGVKLTDTHLENIDWGNEILQEARAREARKNGNHQEAVELLKQAEEVARNLRLENERHGLFEIAGFFFRKEMKMRRLRMPRYSISRATSKLVDMLCGYGEKPLNVVKFSIMFILLCACFYFLLGINQNDASLALSAQQSVAVNLTNFFSCLYFSIVTFTTLGYGDLTPLGITRVIAAFEAFIGSFTMALYVVVFVKKMTR